MKKEAIIVDIDGTLANCEHRRHFIDGTHEKQDWKSFYESMINDTVNDWCKFIMGRCYDESGRIQTSLLLISGRPEEYRELTLDWLIKYHMWDWQEENKLFMRKTGDFRDDCVIKEEIYREHIEPHYDVLFCIDDRPKVCRLWRSIGLICLQCNDKEF
jgi:hypothetical protein